MQRATAKIKGVLDTPKAPEKLKEPPKEEALEEMERKLNPSSEQWRIYDKLKKRVTSEYSAKEAGWTTKTGELEKKIAELTKRPQTVANDDKIKFLEGKLEELGGQAKTYQQRLAERDYSESDDYKNNYVQPFHNTFAKARKFTSSLQVLPVVDESTGEQVSPTRQATDADFDKIFNASPQQRYDLATKMFGQNLALGVVRRAEDLDGLNEKALDAIADHSKNFEKLSQERTVAQQKEHEGYQSMKEQQRIELETELPDMFSVEHYKDQPELQKVLASSYADYDNIRATYHQMSPEDRAANEVLARAHYAAMPLMHKQVQALKSQVESLTAELTKVRGSDPGAEKPAGGVKPAAEQIGGILEQAAKFNE